MLSTGRHFHSLFPVCRFFSFLGFGNRSPEAIRFRSCLQNVSTVRDPIQQGLAEPRIRNHLGPLGEGQVRCHNHGGPLGAFGDHLKQKLRPDFRQRHGRRLRIATKYWRLTQQFFSGKHGIQVYRIVESLGATEGAPAAGSWSRAKVDV